MAIDDSAADPATTPATGSLAELDDFGAEDDFDAEVYYPYAPPQQWVVLHDQVGADELGVYTFVMAHLNPHNGKFDGYFGRQRICQRFGRSVDWVDKRLKALVEVGAMSKVATYWVDAHDHSKGRSTQRLAADGTKRAQAPNRYRVRIAPPGGAAYAGPIKIAEFYNPDLIAKRAKTAGEGGAAAQRPGSEQAKQDDDGSYPQVEGGAAVQRPGGPPHSGRGGRHTAAQKNTGGKTTGQKITGTAEDDADSVGDPNGLRPLGPENPSTATVVGGSSVLELSDNHLNARAEIESPAPQVEHNTASVPRTSGRHYAGAGALAVDRSPAAAAELKRITSGGRARSWRDRPKSDPAGRQAALGELDQVRRTGTPRAAGVIITGTDGPGAPDHPGTTPAPS